MAPDSQLEKTKSPACEIDTRLAAELQERIQAKPLQPKLQVLIGDFFNAELPFFDQKIKFSREAEWRIYNSYKLVF